MTAVEVFKGKTIELPVSLGFNVSEDTIVSQIRAASNPESTLIATWSTSFLTDGTDGELILTLDDSITSEIVQSTGYMFMQRTSGDEPLDIFPEPLEVVFIEE